MKEAWRYLLPLAAFAVLLAFLAVGLKRDPRAVPSPLVDRPAPAFQLPLLDQPGSGLGRADLLGQVWLLNVWASWCQPCREEHPVLMDFARRQRTAAQPVAVVGLHYKDTRPAGLALLARDGNPYRHTLFDNDGRVGLDFGVYGVPETFVIDRQGVVRHKHVGVLTPAVLKDRIEPLLAQLQAR